MTLLYILLAVIVLLVLITVHEFGHYSAGKLLKFKINEFSIGFGKAIFSKTNKKTGEKFSIRIFPLGGYCAFEGEDQDGKDNPDAFNNQKAWKRLIVLFAGVFFNFIFGIMSAIVFLLVSGYSLPKITGFLPDATNPNAIVSTVNGTNYGLQTGDEILLVNGKKIRIYGNAAIGLSTLSSLSDKSKEGEEITLTVLRNGKRQNVVVSKYAFEKEWYVGNEAKLASIYYKNSSNELVAVSTAEKLNELLVSNVGKFSDFFYKSTGEVISEKDIVWQQLSLTHAEKGSIGFGINYSFSHKNYYFFDAIGESFVFCIKICWLILTALGGLFVGKTKLKDMGGTITTISQVAKISSYGVVEFLYLIPLLSMNLALFNFLPIPALDGARFTFVLIELIFRKPVPRKIEAYIHTVGLFVLLSLVLFFDIFHFVS